MNKIIFKLIIIVFIFHFFYACGSSGSKYTDLFLTEDNNGQTVEIGIDNKIVIKLESNPTTGYLWIHSNADGSFIYKDGESIYSSDSESIDLDGRGGVESLTFKANQTGSGVWVLPNHMHDCAGILEDVEAGTGN